jgi:large subunit ribosomal protein L18
MNKNQSRLRRARRTRAKIRELGVPRLSVHRTPRHMYAQVISPDGDTVVAAVSTLSKELRKAIAEKAKAAGVTRVAFDRSGFRYHGRVKALAEAARENGLEF